MFNINGQANSNLNEFKLFELLLNNQINAKKLIKMTNKIIDQIISISGYLICLNNTHPFSFTFFLKKNSRLSYH